ncbi:PREDICTED: uncharacterized protein LOC108382951 [Rhagoletis zephyria]|uniref:uncharacterized protein LOC108382951 n=1 Tax=Rhagoletis zephyria TaxID=28612 RepID=UPI000811354B|nr:PREDICTED: uncharacterized protein LOC108382951 [Rhagoletis zephyria]
MPYLLSTDGALTVQKDVKGGLTAQKGGVVRRMFVVNEPFAPGAQRVITAGTTTPSVVKKQDQQQVLSINCDKNYLLVDQSDQSHSLTNGIVDTKSQTILTTAGAKTHFSPIGPIHLTAEECNEILMKRALAASHQTHTITTPDGHGTTSKTVKISKKF